MTQSIIDILEDLEATSSRLSKDEILKENKKNVLLRDVLVASMDPNVVYYVNKFKLPPPAEKRYADDDLVVKAFLEKVLPLLSSREVTGNAAKELLWMTLQVITERQQKWIMRIVMKNLRCGVKESTVNKVWPGAIKLFAVALAETLKTSQGPKGIKIESDVKYPVWVEPKLDGLRCVVVKRNGRVTMFTRSGTELMTLPRIAADVAAIPHDNFVLDAEAFGQDWNESASVIMSHKRNKDDSGIVLNVFDALQLDEWDSQKTTRPHTQRHEWMLALLATAGSTIQVVPGNLAQNEKELLKEYSNALSGGHEGVMLKNPDGLYIFKRSKNILKMKPVVTYEGVIVGHYTGRKGTKLEDQFGGFNVVLTNGAVTRLGGGFSDVQRAQFAVDPDSLIGKIAEFEAQPDPATADGLTVDGRARFPVFCRFRDAADVDPALLIAYENYTSSDHT